MSKKFQFSPSRQWRMFSILFVLIAVSLACGPPANTSTPEQPQRAAVETAVQATLNARPADSNPTQPSVNPSAATQAPSAVEASATLPPPPTATPTSSKPMVSVSVDTNCRLGPGKDYKLDGALLVGEETEVIARDPSSNYWYVRNPDKPNQFCWLWGNYATVTGDYSSLPVFTPPPTSTPEFTATPATGFSAAFHETDGCVGWELEFLITNNGGTTLESVSITVTDNNTAQSVNNSNDNFEERNGCLVASSQSELLPSEVGFAVGGVLVNNPAGHNIDAIIRVCTQNGLGGTCTVRNMSFTP